MSVTHGLWQCIGMDNKLIHRMWLTGSKIVTSSACTLHCSSFLVHMSGVMCFTLHCGGWLFDRVMCKIIILTSPQFFYAISKCCHGNNFVSFSFFLTPFCWMAYTCCLYWCMYPCASFFFSTYLLLLPDIGVLLCWVVRGCHSDLLVFKRWLGGSQRGPGVWTQIISFILQV